MTVSALPPSRPSLHRDHPQGSRALRTDEVVASMRGCRDEDRLFCLQQELIDLNAEVARSIASRYQHRGVPLEDLEQVALLALIKSARRFQPDSGFAFLSFSVPTIRGEVRRYFRDHGWMVRPPRALQELQYRISQASSDLTTAGGEAPSAKQLAEYLGEPIENVREAADGRGSFSPASLDRRAGEEHDGASLGDLMPAREDAQASAEARVVLSPAVRRLSQRDQQILRMRFTEGLTQREIAEVIGVTQMQVSRLLTRIFKDLREQIGEICETA